MHKRAHTHAHTHAVTNTCCVATRRGSSGDGNSSGTPIMFANALAGNNSGRMPGALHGLGTSGHGASQAAAALTWPHLCECACGWVGVWLWVVVRVCGCGCVFVIVFEGGYLWVGV